MRMQNVYLLTNHPGPKPKILIDSVGIVKARQRKFRYVRKTRCNLVVQWPYVSKRCQPHIVAIRVQMLQKLDGLAFCASDLEVVDQVKHTRTATFVCRRGTLINSYPTFKQHVHAVIPWGITATPAASVSRLDRLAPENLRQGRRSMKPRCQSSKVTSPQR